MGIRTCKIQSKLAMSRVREAWFSSDLTPDTTSRSCFAKRCDSWGRCPACSMLCAHSHFEGKCPTTRPSSQISSMAHWIQEPFSNRVAYGHKTHCPNQSHPLQVHNESSVAPSNSILFPSGHGLHSDSPRLSAYESRGHFLHSSAPLSFMKYPRGQSTQCTSPSMMPELPG